jgi:hypothetical protein
VVFAGGQTPQNPFGEGFEGPRLTHDEWMKLIVRNARPPQAPFRGSETTGVSGTVTATGGNQDKADPTAKAETKTDESKRYSIEELRELKDAMVVVGGQPTGGQGNKGRGQGQTGGK